MYIVVVGLEYSGEIGEILFDSLFTVSFQEINSRQKALGAGVYSCCYKLLACVLT